MPLSSTDWERLSLPAPIPELVVRPTTTQLFMFSAATWNRHHVHYDKDAALAEGLPGVVVHRALLGNFLARLLTEWVGDPGAVAELSWKVSQSALPGRDLHCDGEVVALEGVGAERRARCELRIRDADGRDIASGQALLRVG